MVLLAGQAAGKYFGPGTYADRLVWMHEGTPPNIVGTYNSILLFVCTLLPQYETGIVAHLEQTRDVADSMQTQRRRQRLELDQPQHRPRPRWVSDTALQQSPQQPQFAYDPP